MSTLSRTAPAPTVRHVHLGLGNFFRAHQAWYTEHAPDGQEWGIAAFTGRSPQLSDDMAAQDGLFTLVTRAADGDRFEVVGSVAKAHAASDHAAWLAYFADPQVAVVTTTVTEAGYLRAPGGGGVDAERPEVRSDLDTLRSDPTARVLTAPARIVAGLAARRAADAGPLTIVPCDNLPDNGPVVAGVLRDTAERWDPDLARWMDANVAYVTTMVDRITPEPTAADLATVESETGVADRAPVVTEPFSEWVLSGEFTAGRPRWEDAGATFTDDVGPFEQRKLWLLNGAHSTLAYAGSIRGHETVADAMQDATCRAWLQEWWDAASGHLALPADDVAAYRDALTERFANPRMRHLLGQIAADGSQKLPIRVVPVLLRERAAGRLPLGATRPLAAWVCHLRGSGAPVTDARADEVVPLAAGPLPEAVRRVLGVLDPALADDEVVAAVVDQVGELGAS
ncbi:mannitol dehydrogenase family protein [Cellulomonas fimi]|uniref:Mannitol dehydrogenase family protein n=1 Tax=Cellulomonas fimi TaxID=1708 RepID=A0A7Y0QHK5_CELFI|nr:mannitol dehydrogenase family protein [Cellulomonas fimi]NMR21271.1 mannitol dehydrogenase family protein [Cellulomonas fimi]